MSREQAMQLDESEVAFLAARVRRLCQHFDYPYPKKENDQFIVAVAASLIGAVLTKLELEKRNAPDLEQQDKDAARYKWLRDQFWVEEEARFRLNLIDIEYPNVYQLALDEAIDAAIKESGHD